MWPVKEVDLDRTFLGQWELTRVDDYLTEKAGTASRSAIVRSQIDQEGGFVKFYSHLPRRYNLDPIKIDGTFGLCGRITERIKIDGSHHNVPFLYLRVIKACEILKKLEPVETKGTYILKGKVEMDDLVFNLNDDYTFDCTYHVKAGIVLGLSFEVPISKFNHYVKMRDLWYKDYNGAKGVTSEG